MATRVGRKKKLSAGTTTTIPAPGNPISPKKPRAEKHNEDHTESDNPSQGIRAMLVGLSILRAMAHERRAMPLRDVAAITGMSPSRVHRYLASLTVAGFVEQNTLSGHYGLGQSAIELGLLALGQIEPLQIGIEALVAFSKSSGLDGHLSVWGTFGPTVIRWQPGHLGHHLKIEEGRVLSLLWSATGRVLMAYRDFREIALLLEPELAAWNVNNPQDPITKGQIIKMCAAVRDHGSSSALPQGSQKIGLLLPEFQKTNQFALETTAVPIADHLGRVQMALTFFINDDLAAKDFDLSTELKAAARATSRRLGGGS